MVEDQPLPVYQIDLDSVVAAAQRAQNEDGDKEDGAVFEFLDAISRDPMERLTVQGMVVKDQQVLDLVGNCFFFRSMP